MKNPDKIEIVYFGTPQFSAYILEELIKKFKVKAVITQSDKPIGRKQIIESSEVSKVAEKYNIPTLKPNKLNQEFIQKNKDLLESDIFVVASYGKIIPQTLLDLPKLGAINVHPSLLPKYRGPAPILTPILNGDKETGVTIMLMDHEMDHGDILSSKVIELSEQDNNDILTTKLAQASGTLLIDTLVKFLEGKVIPKPQNHELATYTKMTTKDDGFFDISNPLSPEILDRMVRAYYPWPGVWTKWNNKVVKLYPGKLIQMEGKKIVPLKEFLNGYPNFPIKEF